MKRSPVLNAPTQARLGWRIQNAQQGEADIDIFDIIGDPWDGVTAADFVRDLRALKDVARINLNINSPGGFVSDALAMYAALQDHPAVVTAYVMGQAASAASFVAMAANKIVIAKHATMTIHEAHGFGMGTAADFKGIADELESQSQNIASIYAERAGGTADEWRERMLANGGGLGTTYRGQEAVDVGLADEVVIPNRNTVPFRAAAMANAAPETATNESTEIDLAAAMKAAKPERPEPTLESLFGKYSMKEAVKAGVASAGGKHG